MSEQSHNYLSFRVGPEWYGVNIDYITEVLHFVGLTELPGTNNDVLGLLTLRDTVMPVVDLRRRFRLPDSRLQLNTPIIAMRAPKGALGIVVDDVDDVEELSGIMDYEGDETPHIKGVIKQEDRLLLLLDVDRIYRDTHIKELEKGTVQEQDQRADVDAPKPVIEEVKMPAKSRSSTSRTGKKKKPAGSDTPSDEAGR